ncbi:unnamed protein product [Meganyctiphanes norvegica]|uniref:PUM-HD domain-containing protein n=1 Tax=Meganyctiphanes norvegica TaxID=48144 RepID=A0AAV2SS99_MEGNR
MGIKGTDNNHVKSKKRDSSGDDNDEIKKFKKMKGEELVGFEKTKKRSFKKKDGGGKMEKKGGSFGQGKPSKGKFDKHNKMQVVKKDDNEKVDWKKMKEEKKELKQKRKVKTQGGSENFELGVTAKKIWEELRQEKIKPERKEELCSQLHKMLKGKFKGLIFAHDTVRVIECLVANGSQEYQTAIYEELKGDLLLLAKNKYSRFFVLKLLRYGPRDQKDAIILAFKGKVVELMKHKVACEVVELAYNDWANAKQRSMMIQEFFGPHFRLFHEDDLHNLDDALKKHPERRETILADMRLALQPILDKGVFTNTMVHTLLKDYLTHCKTEDRPAIIEILKEALLPIIHSRDGARVAMLCLWHGTAKDRKATLKSFKTHYMKIAQEEFGSMVLLAAFDCVDDTQFLKKAVLNEVMEGIESLTATDSGRRILRYLVAPRSPSYFQPGVLAVLEQGDGNVHSKKDAPIRRAEIQAAVSDNILKLIEDNIEHWPKNTNWTLFMGDALKTCNGTALEVIFKKLATICAEPYVPGVDGHFLEIAHTNKMISYIIKSDKDRNAVNWPLFSPILLHTVGEEAAGWINSNRGCFLLVIMIETEVPSVVEKVKEIVTPLKGKLKSQKFKGAQILMKKL